MKKSVHEPRSQPIIGIDLGTTNSCVAIYEKDPAEVICNLEGARTTPSAVSWNGEDELVGKAAWRQRAVRPEAALYSIKRVMGRRHDDPAVQSFMKRVSFAIVEGPDEGVRIRVPTGGGGHEDWAPEQISAKVLRAMKVAAEKHLGQLVTEAVITVPAYFDDAQRKATQDAGKLAGLEVKRIINEPTAAALAYGLHRNAEGIVAVFDLGGGTFDVSLLRIKDGTFEVLATAGDNVLGGDDVDAAVVDYCIDVFKRKEGVDLANYQDAKIRLLEAAEEAKKALSTAERHEITLPFICPGPRGALNFSLSLSRATLESIAKEFIERTREPCRKVLRDSGIKPSQIEHLLLVGGMTRMPMVRQVAEGEFGQKARCDINPDEAVAAGAAVQGAILSGAVDDVLLLDVTPLTLGVGMRGDIFSPLIERNSTIPTVGTNGYVTSEDDQTSVNIPIYQGERPVASENREIGVLLLTGIPPAPRGVAKIECTFDIDENGVLKVSARERASGQSCEIRIEGTGRISDEEMERMLEEARRHEQSDRQRRGLSEVRNAADDVIYQAHKRAKKATQEGRNYIQQGVARLEAAMTRGEVREIQREIDRLLSVINDMPAEV